MPDIEHDFLTVWPSYNKSFLYLSRNNAFRYHQSFPQAARASNAARRTSATNLKTNHATVLGGAREQSTFCLARWRQKEGEVTWYTTLIVNQAIAVSA
jgi:hypothetical protein